MGEIILKPGRDKPLLRRHPWVFSGAIAEIHGAPHQGETVLISDANHEPLAVAAYSPQSQITARVWSWDPDETIDRDFFYRRLKSSVERRITLFDPATTDAYRLVHAESDALPGLIVDRYHDLLVFQCLTSGAEYWREALIDLMRELTAAQAIYERSDVEVRKLEGLAPRSGPVYGPTPQTQIQIRENELSFWVDVVRGHKTGFYLDQRENRKRVAALAAGREILNAFCYTGSFGVYALAAGAKHVISVDTSSEAVELGKANIELNHLPGDRAEWVVADVFQLLRRYRDEDRKFDLIILDPPRFAPTTAQVHRATRGYKDINLLAYKLLRLGGYLATFSCSGGVSPELFQKIVADAALDAEVEAQILERLTQGPDHPVALNFPEGAYLKGLICRVV